MSDPLKLLREYIIAAKPIKEKDDYIIFGDTAFPKSAKTNYLVWKCVVLNIYNFFIKYVRLRF